MSTCRDIYLERDEAPAQPLLEELLQRESEDEDALSLADFDDGHWSYSAERRSRQKLKTTRCTLPSPPFTVWSSSRRGTASTSRMP